MHSNNPTRKNGGGTEPPSMNNGKVWRAEKEGNNSRTGFKKNGGKKKGGVSKIGRSLNQRERLGKSVVRKESTGNQMKGGSEQNLCCS